MIKVEHLYKSFGDLQVLRDINLDFEAGKCNMIIGASGSGKTVLLKNLIGLLEPDFETVLGNVIFPMNFFTDWTEKEKVERARFCLDRVNVSGADNRYPSELSGGMQKRVGIARAIALNPDFLFCDEPNSGLDPYTASLIDNLIHGITEEFNITTVINTHDMNSILEIGDSIEFICNGTVLWKGDRHSIMHTSCRELRTFVGANVLARHMIDESE